jgi:hypothetical protein
MYNVNLLTVLPYIPSTTLSLSFLIIPASDRKKAPKELECKKFQNFEPICGWLKSSQTPMIFICTVFIICRHHKNAIKRVQTRSEVEQGTESTETGKHDYAAHVRA